MKSSPSLNFALAVACTAMLGACSKHESLSANSATDANATARTEQTSAAASTATVPTASSSSVSATPASTGDAQVVDITAIDAMKYSTNEIHAKAGSTVTVNLKNAGTLPKNVMAHNFVLLKSQDDVQPFITDSIAATGSGYIAPADENRIIVHTKLLGPGESDSITFKAPDKAGHYPFLCSYPGHYAVGMKGELIVE